MEEIDWSLLPHQPQEFFGLAEPYDRKDLKRKYNQFIRHYKPEQHPAEFQKIRSAFEFLDQQLRYGAAAESMQAVASIYEWSPPTANDSQENHSAASSDEEKKPASQTPQKSLSELLETHSPAELYLQIKRDPYKSPAQFFALAFLSELQPDADRQSFLKWLLAGLKQHPHDPGLTSLLGHYLKTEVDAKHAPLVLKATANVIRDDHFYYVTEGLWDLLLRDQSFSVFRGTLESCERQITDHRIYARQTFYLHVLKGALWVADPEWLEQILATVDKPSSELSSQGEFELEILEQLRGYREVRAAFLNGDKLREEIDRVIQSYCLDEEADFDRKFLALAVRIGTGIREIREALWFPNAGDFIPVFNLWFWLNREVASRQGILDDQDEPEPQQLRKLAGQVRSLLREIAAKTNTTIRAQFWDILMWGRLLLIGFIYLAIFLGIFALHEVVLPETMHNVSLWLAIPLAAIASYFGGRLLSHRVIQPLWWRYCRWTTLKLYQQVWRQDLSDFFAQTDLSYHSLVELLEQIQDQDLAYSDWIAVYARMDFGLAMIASARRYLA